MANSSKEQVVMNGAGIAEIGFPMWPQFDEKSYTDVVDILKSGKVSYWTGIICSTT